MTLTMKEKNHWKERIEQKIERRINSIIEATDRGYLENVRKKAREQAIDKLGLTENRKRQAEIDTKFKKLNDDLDQLRFDAIKIVTNLNVDEVKSLANWKIRESVDSEITNASKAHERIVMEGDELGRTILKLRDEQEELLDTVWLATSTKEIRDLWQSVAEFLNEEPTALQSATMKSVAIKSDATE